MASTYTLIASNTLGSDASVVSFTNINGGYTDLVLRGSIRGSETGVTGENLAFTINGLTTTIYSTVGMRLAGTSIQADSAGGNPAEYFGFANGQANTANTFTNFEINIPSYLSSYEKQTSSDLAFSTNSTSTPNFRWAAANLVKLTAGVNSIQLFLDYNIAANSSFYLYGVWKGTGTTLPSTPTIGTATDAGTGTSVSVAFTPTSSAGVDAGYTALSTPGSITASSGASPITVSGLTTGTAYTFQVRANNPGGSSAYSAASNSVTVANPPGWSSIATATGAGNPSTITFNSIPQGYTDLQIRGINANTGTSLQNLYLTFNGDTTSSYYFSHLFSNGASGSAGGGNASAVELSNAILSTSQNSMYSPVVIDIIDYASGKKPTVHFLYTTDANISSGSYRIAQGSGIWNNTNAITSISLQTSGGSFNTYTEFALYGLKASA